MSTADRLLQRSHDMSRRQQVLFPIVNHSHERKKKSLSMCRLEALKTFDRGVEALRVLLDSAYNLRNWYTLSSNSSEHPIV